MADPTPGISDILLNTSVFDIKDLNVIIAFVNELDSSMLYQFENESERTVMNSFDRLRARASGDATNSVEMGLVNRGDAGTVLSNNSSFFSQYGASLPFERVFGSAYNERRNINYDYISKILGNIGGLSTLGAGIAATAAAEAGKTLASNAAVRFALYALGGGWAVTGSLAMIRNFLSSKRQANNKELLEATKSVAKVRSKLNDFFASTQGKIFKSKKGTQDAWYRIYHTYRHSTSPASSANLRQAPNDGMRNLENLVLNQFTSPTWDITAKIQPHNNNASWNIEVYSNHGMTILSPQEMTMLNEIAGQL